MTSNYDSELHAAWDYYYDKIDALNKREAQLADFETAVYSKATELTKDKTNALEIVYNEHKRVLEDEKNKTIALFKIRYYTSLCYGIILTTLSAVMSSIFMSELASFFKYLFYGLKGLLYCMWSIGGLAARLGDLIPSGTIGIIVHWILQISITGSALVISGIYGLKGSRFLIKMFSKYYRDEITVYVSLLILAVAVMFADYLALIPINLILHCILAFMVYMLARGFCRWDNAETKKLVIAYLIGITLIIALIRFAICMAESLP